MLLDAHADTWEEYYGERYFHGTPFKRAMEEGLIDPSRSLLAGMRGPLYAALRSRTSRASWGFEIVSCDELRTWTPDEYAARARAGRGRARVPVVRHRRDRPALRPPRARPRSAGCCPHEAIAFLRALRGMRFTGFDLVEVAPAYDTNAQVTALLAANVAYEMLTLVALARLANGGH